LAARALWICALLALIASSVLGVALPADEAAAQPLGGRQFTLTSQGAGVVVLSWATGTGQTGYRLNRITSAGTVVVAPSIAGTATSFTDNLGTQVAVACYQLEILNGTNVVGRSDILCVIVNVAGGTHPPRNVAIFTNETAGIGIRWDAPTNTSPAVLGYIVVPLGGAPLVDASDGDTLFSPTQRQALDIPTTPFRCYIVLALIPDSSVAPFRIGGFSDIVCAFVGTFSPQPATATATRTSTATQIGGPPTNTLTATGTVLTTTPVNTATPTITSTLTPPNLGVVLKTDDPDPVPPGGNVLYTITLTNTGQSASSAVFVEDPLPAGLTFLTASANQLFTCNDVAGTVACSSPSLAGGATATISILARADNPCVVISPITNTVRARIGGPPNPAEPNTVQASQSTTLSGCTQATATATRTATATLTRTITVTGLPATATATPGVDLQISKIDAPDPVPNGQPLTYTVVVTNVGTIAATNITVIDQVDLGLLPIGAAGDSGFVCSIDAVFTNAVTCTGGNIGANGGATITIVTQPFANPCDGTVFTNTVTVDPSNTIPESNETNNVAQIATICGAGQNTPVAVATFTRTVTQTRTITPTVTAIPTTAFNFLKLDAPDPVVLGGSVTYTLRLTNTGSSAISDITLNDVLPAQTVFLGTGAVGGGFVCNHFGAAPGGTGGTVACADGSVAAGATVDIEIIVSVQGCGPLVNTATIVSPVVANNIATSSTTVTNCLETITPTVTTTGTVTLTTTVTATPSITSTAVTNITIAKAPASGPVLTGDAFSYTVTMNAAPADAVFTAAQVSMRDVLPTGITSSGAPTSSYGATCTVLPGPPQIIECTGGTITTGVPATVTIPVTVTGCGALVNVANADPNNVISETNEADNLSTPVTHTNTCDTQITKIQASDVIDTSAGASTQGYLLLLDDVSAGQTQVAASTISDTLPAGFVVNSVTPSAGGVCTTTGTPPAAQTVTCTNLAGLNGATGVIINADVPTSVTRGDKINNASVTTPGDVNAANNTASATSTVYNFDVSVSIVDTQDPVVAGQYAYQVTVTNTSAGGFASGQFFVNGGLFLRNSAAAGDSFGSAAGFALIPAGGVTSASAVCTYPSAGVGGADQRYACLVNSIPAGGSITINAVANWVAAEADGAEEVSLDANLVNQNPIVCGGGGLSPTCAPETTGVVVTNTPAFNTLFLANNRDVEFTDID